MKPPYCRLLACHLGQRGLDLAQRSTKQIQTGDKTLTVVWWPRCSVDAGRQTGVGEWTNPPGRLTPLCHLRLIFAHWDGLPGLLPKITLAHRIAATNRENRHLQHLLCRAHPHTHIIHVTAGDSILVYATM